jgi:hypothetical protein
MGLRREGGWGEGKYLPVVSGICSGTVVGEGFGAGELVVGGGRRDDVALGGDLAGEAGDGAGHFEVSGDPSREENNRGGKRKKDGRSHDLCRDVVLVERERERERESTR